MTTNAIPATDFESPAFTYDIATATDWNSASVAAAPGRVLAEVRKLVKFPFGNARRRDRRFRVLLNDHRILAVHDRHPSAFNALLLLVLTHELIHIARFATFRREFEASRRARRQEEQIVSALTETALSHRAVRKSFDGLTGLIDHFRRR